eukprot:CAMPEP_0183438494 /NCGR_PEP_ID=MMETSP0370-20130417/77417_1 /TAXON_ID=268820 /ORGANISM="Peridinium aciculiferum, Strain PAER-2" /LENGTH=86 /DNA_ID=CAMNT_0025626727 /DNA_START=24 /DNA_END=285 /DNA_ORIENTATION=-
MSARISDSLRLKAILLAEGPPSSAAPMRVLAPLMFDELLVVVLVAVKPPLRPRGEGDGRGVAPRAEAIVDADEAGGAAGHRWERAL